jgi:hypothetical protein
MVFLSPMRNERCTPASIAANSRCFEGLLLVFDSGYSGVCTLAADDHLAGILPVCKQLFFLGHLQNHNIVLDGLLPWCFLVGCALIVCWTLGIRSWIDSISCFPMSLAVLVLRVPEIPFQNQGVLRVVAQDLEPFWRFFCRLPLYELHWTSLYALSFWGTKHISFFLKRLGCCWNSIASFQRVTC